MLLSPHEDNSINVSATTTIDTISLMDVKCICGSMLQDKMGGGGGGGGGGMLAKLLC